jgi:hypothetical protein
MNHTIIIIIIIIIIIMPKPVYEEGDVTVLWNQAVHTDREVRANRPDIIIIKQKRENMHTDRCVNTGRQTRRSKEAEKRLKYKSLCIEIQRMWNLKCTIIPVIIGATGMVTRSLRKNLETVPRKHSIDSLQKTAILGTSHIIRKVLQCEARSLSGGDHRWFKRSTGKERPVTRDIHNTSNNNNNNNNNNNRETCFPRTKTGIIVTVLLV